VNIDRYIVLGSAVIGFLVGLTGAGGGALMTPMLILSLRDLLAGARPPDLDGIAPEGVAMTGLWLFRRCSSWRHDALAVVEKHRRPSISR
jgi:hypothetical protein